MAVDVETRDEKLRSMGIGVRHGGYVVGISFAIEDGPKHYLPIRHQGGDNMDEGPVLAYLRAQAKEFDGTVVGANLDYDLDYLAEEGVAFTGDVKFKDVQIADPIIYELHQSYSLDNILKRHGLPGKNEDLLRQAAADFKVDPKKDLWKLPARYVGAYAEDDAAKPLLLLRRQERLIDEHDLWDIWNLECQVLPVLLKMRRRGVRIDTDQLARIEKWARDQEAESLQKIKHATGVQIALGDVWKADAIAPSLKAIGLELQTTSQGKPQIDKELLSRTDHPVAKALLWARKTNKLRTTFAASVRQYMVNGRIHCTFNQIAREDEDGDQKGARYGRLSCVDPNLQQQPARDEFSKEWRKIYLPEEGAEWGSSDYSQQEPRWTTHFAALIDLPGARKAAQAYHDDPNLDNHQFMADLTGLPRKHAKNVYLGLCYGEGGAKLCRDLGLPTRWALTYRFGRARQIDYYETREQAIAAMRSVDGGRVFEAAGEEGQRVLDTFDSRAPFIRMLSDEAKKKAEQRGYIITGGGRQLHFPQRNDGSYDWAHKALNRLIQGTSADQMKKALVEVDRAGHFLQLQVHDEMANSLFGGRAEGERIATIMREVMPALVPFKVDVEIGRSWGDSMG